MNRRGFLGSILALGAAPAIVRADSLMRIVPRGTSLVTGAAISTREMRWIIESTPGGEDWARRFGYYSAPRQSGKTDAVRNAILARYLDFNEGDLKIILTR